MARLVGTLNEECRPSQKGAFQQSLRSAAQRDLFGRTIDKCTERRTDNHPKGGSIFSADRRGIAVGGDPQRSLFCRPAMMETAPRLENYSRAAGHIDQILRGAKVADLPFQEPTRLTLSRPGHRAVPPHCRASLAARTAPIR